MQAVILAGGQGTRMRTVNSDIPKSMLPINGKPLLEYQIEFLKSYGITDIILRVNYLKDSIQSFLDRVKNGEFRSRILRKRFHWER